MRNILFLFILFTTVCQAQYGYKDSEVEVSVYTSKNDTITIIVSEKLKDNFIDFLVDAKKYKISLENLKDLHSITRSNTIPYHIGSDALGVTLLFEDFKNLIFIDYKIRFYEIKTLALYHELGHQLLQNTDHCDEKGCPLLMTKHPNTLYKGKKVYLELLTNWKKHKKEFFKYLLKRENDK